MSSINSITYKNICKTKYMPNWAHIPFLLWSDSGSDNMGLTFPVLHWVWDHGPWVLPLVKRVSLGGLSVHCMAPIWLKHTIHWRKKQTICQVSTKLPLKNVKLWYLQHFASVHLKGGSGAVVSGNTTATSTPSSWSKRQTLTLDGVTWWDLTLTDCYAPEHLVFLQQTRLDSKRPTQGSTGTCSRYKVSVN